VSVGQQPQHAMPAISVAPTQVSDASGSSISLPHASTNDQPDLRTVAIQVAARAKDGDRHFDIRLDPPEFGKIDVRLSVTNGGHAQAHIAADKPQTLDLLQRDQAMLHRALKDAGLDLSNNSLNFSLKGQERGDSSGSPYAGRAPSLTATESTEATGPFPFTPSRAASGRLDIRI